MRHRRVRAHAVAIAIAISLVGVLPSTGVATASAAEPAAGWLDPTFGTRGVVVIPRSVAGRDARAWGSLSVSSTGRIYTMTQRGGSGGRSASTIDLAAFTPTGRLDGAFNRGFLASRTN